MARQFRPRKAEADGLKYYQERNKAGDYLSVDDSEDARKYYRDIGQGNIREARCTAIQGDVTSVCTAGVSLEFLRSKCRRVRKADIPAQWLERL